MLPPLVSTRFALAFLLGVLSVGAAPQLRLSPDPSQPTNLALSVQFALPPSVFTLYAADSVEALRTNRAVQLQGFSSSSSQVISLALNPAMPQRFFTLAEKPTGKVVTQMLDSPAEDQTVVLDGIRLTVPAQSLSSAQTVRVATHTPQSAGATNLWPSFHTDVIYEIQIGTNTVFDPPLTIEIPYDPDMLNRQLAVEDAVTVAWWLPEEHHWVLRPSTVNPERHTVTFQTDHLTFWTLIYTLEGYLVSHSAGGHFKTVYDSNGTSTDNSRSYQYWNTDFADIINGDLENAYNIYVATNTFKPPSTPIWVLIDPSTSDPTWAGKTGDIYVPDNFDGLEALRQELAHELFHAVQNRYYNVYAAGFGGRIWWHEACADFASQSLVMGRTSPFPSGLTPSFLVQPLTTFNARHEYDVANFLDYVFRHSNGKLDFKTHFTELAVWGYYSTLARLADLVRTKTGKELAAYYGEFAADFLFNERGYRPGLDPWSAPVNVQHQHVFPTNSTKYSQTFELKGGYSAQLLATKVLAAKEPRKLRVSVSPPTGNAFIDIYKLSSLRLDSPPTPEWLVQNGGISIDDGEYLCFVAVNCSPDTASTISVTVEDEPSTTITGTTTYQITQGSPSAFTIEGDWILTGEIVTSTIICYPLAGAYYATFTVKTNQPVSFKWNYKLDRNPAERTEETGDGWRRIITYAQPTIDGKTITASPVGNPNPSLQQLITDSTVTLDFLFTNLSQSVDLSFAARPRFYSIQYEPNGQIWNQGSSTEGGMRNMWLTFTFMPAP